MSKNRGNIRKRRVVDEDGQEAEEDTEVNNAEVLREKLEATKHAQRQRRKLQGIDASFLPGIGDAGVEEQAPSTAPQDSKLMESFDRATANLDGVAHVADEDAHMREFVEAQVAARLRRRPLSEPLAPADAAQARQQQLEKELYALPENLVVPRGQTEVVIPGLITGISEVQLPVDARLRNIEETERMKRKLLAASALGAAALVDDSAPSKRPGSDPATNLFHRTHFVPVLGRHKAVKDKDEKEQTAKAHRYIKDPSLPWKRRL